MKKQGERTTMERASKGKSFTSRTREGHNMLAVVLSKIDPKKTASGKNGAVRIFAYVLQVSVKDESIKSVEIEVQKGSEPQMKTVKNGDVIEYLSSFNGASPADLTFGVTVQLECVAFTDVNGTVYPSARSIKVVSAGTYESLDLMPGKFFHMPSLKDSTHSTVVLRFRGASPEIEAEEGAHMLFDVPEEAQNYSFEKDDAERTVAFSAEFSVQQWGLTESGELGALPTVCIDTRLFENHIGSIGILDPKSWEAVGQQVMSNIRGFLPGYIDSARTAQLDINNFRDESSELSYGLSFKGLWGCSVFDHHHFLTKTPACFEVSASFVKEHLGETVSSPCTSKNPLTDPAGSVLNLSEFTGSLTPFFNAEAEGGRFFLLSNHCLDADDVESIRGLSISETEDCFAKKPGSAIRVSGYSGKKCWIFFFMRGQTIGAKRARD